MKKKLALILAAVLVFSFSACGISRGDGVGVVHKKSSLAGMVKFEEELETYSLPNGLTLQMEKGMVESSDENFDAFFAGQNAAMAGVRESAEEFEMIGYDLYSLSIEEYADMVAESNGFDGFQKNENGSLIYTYVRNFDGDDYFYYTTVKKGPDCFWVINFFCPNEYSEEYLPKFNRWAESVQISKQEPANEPQQESQSTAGQPQVPQNTVTTGMRNALASAKSYLSVMSFSYTGLIEQLEYEQYTHEEAVYGADNCGADWYEQAVKSAESYLEIMSFSKDELIEQLVYEGFTYEQAVYGVEQTYD